MDKRRFELIVQRVINEFPEEFRELVDQVPILIEEEARPELLEDLEGGPLEDDEEIYGLHVGTPLTERSPIYDVDLDPGRVYLFRGPLVRLAQGDEQYLEEEIRITLYHEIGHHFGLSEEDLERLGYD
jgi:predicted Zn-dependent protease with MMP-like domain